jgi:hypothetical protein
MQGGLIVPVYIMLTLAVGLEIMKSGKLGAYFRPEPVGWVISLSRKDKRCVIITRRKISFLTHHIERLSPVESCLLRNDVTIDNAKEHK